MRPAAAEIKDSILRENDRIKLLLPLAIKCSGWVNVAARRMAATIRMPWRSLFARYEIKNQHLLYVRANKSTELLV